MTFKLSIFVVALGISLLVDNVSGFSASSSPSSSFEIDTTKAFAESTFPIKPDDLIERAKVVFGPDVGIGTKDGGECLAEDFEFCAAVVGPLPRKEFLNALGTFKLEDSFDITPNAFGWTVSPVQPNRVYLFTHQTAKLIAPFMGTKPSDMTEDLMLPPQCLHIDFNEDGKVTEFGFYTVDRRYGNTGGLGGAFGFFYGVGKPLPIPECQPYKRSFRFRMLNALGRLGQKLKRKKED